ncbi:branched-chain amino acid transport system II carrier protein (plasmid) [Nicoliella spurrieriana]|uniref:Branched-chain amino acid transport system carrier protein n=1 Tax=Nicoliella spurrieriana TaxID=2925830 RepID=A0A976RQP3_9LACO|nr:branched-chain amino acid transport system II carrier protein [Nicoliella spurrieriana]UQS86066.1 branched-chain amino acid transport system II carrier protein [Nicoliella spurrieriana]
MQTSKLNTKQYIILASLLFGLFFGAGNLIFPIFLGQASSSSWLPASAGFLISAIVLPLLSILAISYTESNSLYDLGKPVGHYFALIFLAIVHLSLGVLIASPRTATVTFSMGIQPFFPHVNSHIALFIFSIIFFGLAYGLAFNQTKITEYVGKILNPIFVIILFFVFILAFFIKGDLAHINLLPTAGNSSSMMINGFLQGYNTMDAVAGLGFGVTIIAALKQFGLTDKLERSKAVAKVGTLTMGFEALIYIFLIALGATSLSYLKPAPDGGTAFTQIMAHYTGLAGAGILAALTFLACITTEIGLITSLSQDWGKRFPKLGYHFFLTIATIGSFIIANFGLEQIILYSSPLLNFIYPIAIAIILLGLLNKWIGKNKIIYRTTVILTLIPAILDFIHNLPPLFAKLPMIKAINDWAMNTIPLYSQGLDFIPFLATGLILGLIIAQFSSIKAPEES